MAVVSRNLGCVVLYDEMGNFPYVKGVSAIVVLWALSPVASGLCAALFYVGVYFGVLSQTSDVPFRNAKIFLPFLAGFTMLISTMNLIFKGTEGKDEEPSTAEW